MAERPPLVLLIDDDDEFRSVCAEYLKAVGFQVLEAIDGTSAVGKARTRRPDVILLDLSMRGMNGWQTCRWLKTSVETINIPVIVVTGDPTKQAEREAVEAGCNRFLAKDADLGRVIQAIREVLAH